MTGTAILLFVLILLSAFFSSSETAFLSLSKITVRQLVKEKKRNAHIISRLKAKPDLLITSILIGNTFVNTLASSFATAFAISLFGDAGAGIATLVMTICIIIFGETVPKTIAALRPLETARNSAPLLLVIQTLLFPLVAGFSTLSSAVTALVRRIWKQRQTLVTEEELKTLIELGNQEGTLENREKEMLQKIFEFSDLRVRDIMKHRTFVRGLPDTATFNQTLKAFSSTGFSRLPVYTETIDSICGFLHYKDVLFFRCSGNTAEFSVREAMRPVLFVPETKTAVSLLHTFRAEKQNIAIAVDEHGSCCGIISMDDLLKAVFGRITDEYDASDIPPEERIKIVNQSEFIIPGIIELTDVNNIFNLGLESDYYHTLGGWLLEQFGSLPASGEHILKNQILFIVEEQKNRRIRSVKMKLPEKA